MPIAAAAILASLLPVRLPTSFKNPEASFLDKAVAALANDVTVLNSPGTPPIKLAPALNAPTQLPLSIAFKPETIFLAALTETPAISVQPNPPRAFNPLVRAPTVLPSFS
jgi:hypothetical protein